MTLVALSEVDAVPSSDPNLATNPVPTFGHQGTRAILSVIASSMITVAGLIFSMTMLTLQLELKG